MNFHSRPVQRVDYILSQCTGKRVLHLGCTNWPYTEQSLDDTSLLHPKIAECSGETFGIDADIRGLDILRSRGYDNLYQGDLERLDECELEGTFDIVVAGEMIEHLNNPGLFLQGVKRYLSAGSKLIITTINAYSAMRFLIYGLRGRRGKVEPVHPDHVAYYSLSTIKLLIERHQLEVTDMLFYDIGREHRPYNRAYWNFASDVAVRLSPQLSDGIIVVCSNSNNPKIAASQS